MRFAPVVSRGMQIIEMKEILSVVEIDEID